MSIGKTLATLFLAGAALTQSAKAGLIYTEDFSSDPHWATDQPQNFHWDEESGAFFASMSNSSPQYAPNRFAYTPIDWNGEPFKLQWDSMITRSDWSAGINFGLFDNNLNYQRANTLNIEYTNPDAGRGFTIFAFTPQGSAYQNNWAGFELGRWQTNILEYNPNENLIEYQVSNRDTGELLVDTSLTVNGTFSPEMDLLGFSRYPMGQSNTAGYNPNGTTSGYIDNIKFQIVPEPATAALALTGLAALLARRKPKE